jgi:hypothetical protein
LERGERKGEWDKRRKRREEGEEEKKLKMLYWERKKERKKEREEEEAKEGVRELSREDGFGTNEFGRTVGFLGFLSFRFAKGTIELMNNAFIVFLKTRERTEGLEEEEGEEE